jgi:hypothetical protein
MIILEKENLAMDEEKRKTTKERNKKWQKSEEEEEEERKIRRKKEKEENARRNEEVRKERRELGGRKETRIVIEKETVSIHDNLSSVRLTSNPTQDDKELLDNKSDNHSDDDGSFVTVDSDSSEGEDIYRSESFCVNPFFRLI